jgi:CubicO group peptidase (beta-lactamase class C family)
MMDSFNFQVKGHEISLTPSQVSSANTISIGGRNYSIGGEAEAVELFKKKTQSLDLNSIQLKDIPNELKKMEVFSPSVNKTKRLSGEVLFQKDSIKSEILKELQPTWPLPGQPHISSITDRMKDLKVPGVRVAVINNGKHDWSEGFGELKKPDTLVQAASISKTITSLIIMSLIQENKLTLETDIKDILPPDLWESITHGNKVTIGQLMSHTAGLTPDTKEGYRGYFRDKKVEVEKINSQITELEEKPDRNENIQKRIDNLKLARESVLEGKLPTLDDILQGKGTNSPPVEVTSKPGTDYAYAGGGSMILQKVIETITNKTFEDVTKERIFSKLGIKESTFSPQEEKTVRGNDLEGQPLPGEWVQQPELAAAGLWTTPEDLEKVAIDLQKSITNGDGVILNQKNALEMVTPPLEHAPGHGVFVVNTPDAKYFYHDGSNLGFRCIMIANDQGQGAVVMTNGEWGNQLIHEVVRKIADTYEWKGRESLNLYPPLHPEVQETAKNKIPVKWQPETYSGDYEFNGNIAKVIFHDSGKISFKTPNPKDPLFDVIPVSEHVGIFKDEDQIIPIEFANIDGKITLNVHGMIHHKI